MKRLLIYMAFAAVCCWSCLSSDPGDFTAKERRLIERAYSGKAEGAPDGTMRVLTIDSPKDQKVLRASCTDFSSSGLYSKEYNKLCELMIATVTHPSQDGVGIAGPQVGLNRRVVAVQRFDKGGEPFEVYPNIKIVWASDSLAVGPEGCLSVPDRRGEVARSTEIVIEYTSIPVPASEGWITLPLPTVRETISGFTAVIFQHEVDHLDGVLYIDRM